MMATRMKYRQRGAAVVETIVITPLLLFLILVTAEVTSAFVDHNTLAKSTRNAARYLASNAAPGTTGTVVLTPVAIIKTRNLLVYGNESGIGTSILPGLVPGNVQVVDIGNNRVEVSATYAYTGLLGGTLPSLGLGPDLSMSMNLQASMTVRAL